VITVADTYRIAAGTKVHYDGTTYAEGEPVPLDVITDAELIASWLGAGWIEPAPAHRSRKR
jgi:hypothetical protein